MECEKRLAVGEALLVNSLPRTFRIFVSHHTDRNTAKDEASYFNDS
jgi:hypothetical protein